MAGGNDLLISGWRYDSQGRRMMRFVTEDAALTGGTIRVGGRVRASDGVEECVVEGQLTGGTDLSVMEAQITALQAEVDALQAEAPSGIDQGVDNVKSTEWGPGTIYNHGAIGDGASHPLSAFFATLGAAQAVYPHALGLTDELDWAATQKAVNAQPGTGGTIEMPNGDYIFNRTLKLNEHNLTFFGRGPGQRIGATQNAIGTRIRINAAFVGTEVINVGLDSGVNPVYGSFLHDFCVDLEGIGPAGVVGIKYSSNRGLMDHVHVHRAKGAGIRVIGTTGWDTYDTEIRSCQVAACLAQGILLDTDAADVQIVGGVLYDNNVNFEARSASYQMTGTHTYNATINNILFAGSGSRSKHANMKIEGAGQHGVFFDSTSGSGPSDVQFVGCQFHDNGDSALNTYDHVSHVGTSQTTRALFTGCVFGWKNSATNPTNKPRYAVNAASSGAVNWRISGCSFGPLSNFGTGLVGKASSATMVVDMDGVGTPEGQIPASIGSTYRRTDGGAATSFYVKESGTGNTGWVAK